MLNPMLQPHNTRRCTGNRTITSRGEGRCAQHLFQARILLMIAPGIAQRNQSCKPRHEPLTPLLCSSSPVYFPFPCTTPVCTGCININIIVTPLCRSAFQLVSARFISHRAIFSTRTLLSDFLLIQSAGLRFGFWRDSCPPGICSRSRLPLDHPLDRSAIPIQTRNRRKIQPFQQ